MTSTTLSASSTGTHQIHFGVALTGLVGMPANASTQRIQKLNTPTRASLSGRETALADASQANEPSSSNSLSVLW